MRSQSRSLDNLDRKILSELKLAANTPLDRLASKCQASRTVIWSRIQRLLRDQVISHYTIAINAAKLGIDATFFVAIKTNRHDTNWLRDFHAAISKLPQIVEAHRLAGDTDYLLKVQVATPHEFDKFYQKLIAAVSIYNVTSWMSMEVMKQEQGPPLPQPD